MVEQLQDAHSPTGRKKSGTINWLGVGVILGLVVAVVILLFVFNRSNGANRIVHLKAEYPGSYAETIDAALRRFCKNEGFANSIKITTVAQDGRLDMYFESDKGISAEQYVENIKIMCSELPFPIPYKSPHIELLDAGQQVPDIDIAYDPQLEAEFDEEMVTKHGLTQSEIWSAMMTVDKKILDAKDAEALSQEAFQVGDKKMAFGEFAEIHIRQMPSHILSFYSRNASNEIEHASSVDPAAQQP